MRTDRKPTRGLIAIVAAAGLLTACAGMSPTEQRVLSGGAIGAAGGGAVGAVTGGNPVTGAVLGGAAGAAGGYLYDRAQNQR